MKLYVWEDFYGTGLEFSPGLAVALANSREEAMNLIITKSITSCVNRAHVEKELQKECKIYSSPTAVINEGGS